VSISKDRVVRPFEWGLDWIPETGRPAGAPPEAIGVATVALDPGDDSAVAVWRGSGGQLRYAVRDAFSPAL